MSVFLYAEINLVCILALGIMACRILRTPRPDPAWGLFIRMACCAIALFVTDLVWNLAEHAPTPVSAGHNFCLNACILFCPAPRPTCGSSSPSAARARRSCSAGRAGW